MPLSIRRARSTDAEVIAEFNQRLALESEHKQLDPAILANGVAAALADPAKGWYFVAEEDGSVLGQLMITFEWSDWRNGWIWWIQSVYVRSEARRKGVFRALFEHVRQSASTAPGVVGIRLYVEKENLVAQQTYQRLGLDITGYLVMERCPP
jgi:ribosomal protein S18 acetylase RimI-like enzyme